MSAQFHPPAEMLIDYASGALREAQSLIVATHLALCPECRKENAKCEAIGGTLLEQGEEIAISNRCRDRVMAALDMQMEIPGKIPVYDPFLCNVLPTPLRGYVGCGVTDVPWKKFSRTMDKINIDSCDNSSGKVRLIRVKAGAAMPKHTHTGQEYMVVLAGSVSDGDKTYRRGDFIQCDGTVTHAPVAGSGEDCVCLVVVDGQLQLSGLLGKLISPFIRF